MTFTTLIAWINAAITFGTIVLFGCLGEILNQKSGSLNLGVPGIMMLGGIGAIIGAFFYERSTTNPQALICLLVALGSCILLSFFGGLIYAFLTISLNCNQNVVGLTLTIFGSGFANFFGGTLMKLSGGVGQISLKATSKVFRARIPFLSDQLGFVSNILFNYGFMVYLSLLVAFALWYFLNKTRKGLNLRAIGENPGTADACGINVKLYKYLATLTGAIISGLGGVYYVMDYVMGTWNSDSSIEAIGWLAVALVIFAAWKPLRAIWGSFVFGICYWIFLYMPAFISRALANVLNITNITYLQNLYKAIPYIVTIVVLIIASKNKSSSSGPSALGQSYFREDR